MDNEKLFTGLLIRRAQQTHVYLWQRLVSDEFSSPQFGVMRSLHNSSDKSQADLCDDLDLDRSTIADMVKRLVDRGIILRERDKEDKRRYSLSLTPLGEQEYESLLPRVRELDEALTKRLNSAENSELQRLLKLILIE